MKIQRKQRKRAVSVRKSIQEQTRIRQSYERRLYVQMLDYFQEAGIVVKGFEGLGQVPEPPPGLEAHFPDKKL